MQRRNNKQVFARLFARVCWPAIAHAEITRVNFRFSEKIARKFSSGRATHCTSRYTYLVWHSRRIAEIKLTVQCKACTRGHYAYPPWCTGEPGPSPARIVTCRVVSTAHARRQGSACGAPLPVWELDPLQFEGGRLETEVQWRGALSISKGGGQKSKGGAAPRYVALDETLDVWKMLQPVLIAVSNEKINTKACDKKKNGNATLDSYSLQSKSSSSSTTSSTVQCSTV